MANEQQPDDTGTTPAALTPAGAARRRFTRAGAAASGVLLTLHSQPGMAASVCKTASGFLSGNLQSFRQKATVTCTGLGPDTWAGLNKQSWPSLPGAKKNDTLKSHKFSSVFLTAPAMSTTYGAITLNDILTLQTWDTQGIGRYLAAAYLNVVSGRSTFYTESNLQRIWIEWRDGNVYTPTAGVTWTAYDIVDYLKRTMA